MCSWCTCAPSGWPSGASPRAGCVRGALWRDAYGGCACAKSARAHDETLATSRKPRLFQNDGQSVPALKTRVYEAMEMLAFTGAEIPGGLGGQNCAWAGRLARHRQTASHRGHAAAALRAVLSPGAIALDGVPEGSAKGRGRKKAASSGQPLQAVCARLSLLALCDSQGVRVARQAHACPAQAQERSCAHAAGCSLWAEGQAIHAALCSYRPRLVLGQEAHACLASRGKRRRAQAHLQAR